jgi:hypothetical protein
MLKYTGERKALLLHPEADTPYARYHHASHM